jgi:hypothetical protein
MDVAAAHAQLHSSAIEQNGCQPTRHLCLPLELVQVGIGSEQSVLDRILRIG